MTSSALNVSTTVPAAFFISIFSKITVPSADVDCTIMLPKFTWNGLLTLNSNNAVVVVPMFVRDFVAVNGSDVFACIVVCTVVALSTGIKANMPATRTVAASIAGIGLSEARMVKVLVHLVVMSETMKKNFLSCEKQDFVNLLTKIRFERNLKARTFEDYKAALKKHLQWLGKDVSWIRIRNVESKILPEELLTEEEVLRMITVADSIRDKALVHVLWDSDCRIAEVLRLRIKHVAFDEHGAVLMVNGKTGMRRVRIIESVSILKQYLEAHPFGDDPESPLWIDDLEVMNYVTTWKMLKRVAKIAEVKKRIYPHLFRHSRSTYLAKRVSNSVLASHAGWSHGSRMLIVCAPVRK